MDRVPDDLPRVAGMINAQHSPLTHQRSRRWLGHTQRGANQCEGTSDPDGLDGQWVRYEVEPRQPEIILEKIDAPSSLPQQPAWSVHSIRLEEMETVNTKVVSLGDLRMSEHFRYGTKAANLGELRRVLDHGSSRLTGFYRVPRPPRHDLLQYLASAIDSGEGGETKSLRNYGVTKSLRIFTHGQGNTSHCPAQERRLNIHFYEHFYDSLHQS